MPEHPWSMIQDPFSALPSESCCALSQSSHPGVSWDVLQQVHSQLAVAQATIAQQQAEQINGLKDDAEELSQDMVKMMVEKAERDQQIEQQNDAIRLLATEVKQRQIWHQQAEQERADEFRRAADALEALATLTEQLHEAKADRDLFVEFAQASFAIEHHYASGHPNLTPEMAQQWERLCERVGASLARTPEAAAGVGE